MLSIQMKTIILSIFATSFAFSQPCTVTFTVGATTLSALACGAQNYFDAASAGPSVLQQTSIAPGGSPVFGSVNPSGTVKSSNTLTKTYPWGTIATTYSSSGNSFNISILATNTSAVNTIDGLVLSSAGVLLPSAPPVIPNLTQSGGYQPTAIYFSFAEGTTCLTNPDVATSLGVGMRRVHSNSDVEWNLMTVINDNGAVSSSLPFVTRNIPPLGSDTYRISLVFGNLSPSSTVPQSTIQQLGGSTFAAFNLALPPVEGPQVGVPVADLHDTHNVRPTCINNPRGWQFFPIATCSWDTVSPSGIAAFKAAWIADSQGRLAQMDAAAALGVRPRGMMFWDFDGQNFDVAFIGDPTQIETIAPETAGGTLDAVVNTFINAGYEVGFTLRPQVYSQQSATVNLTGRTLSFVAGTQFRSSWAGNAQIQTSIWLGGNIRMNFFPSSVSSGSSMTLFAPDCLPSGGSGSTFTCSSGVSNSTQGAIAFVPDVNCAAGSITINPGGGVKSLKLADGVTNPGLNGCVAGTQYFVAYNGSVWCIFDANNVPMVGASQENILTPNGGYQVLHDKIAWCRNRWGPKANVFYVDSNLFVGSNSGDYPDSGGFRQLAIDFPGILIFPEWQITGHWSATSPYRDIRNFPTTTAEAPADTGATYPLAQSIVQIDQASLSVTDRANAIASAILHNNFVFYDIVAPGAGSTISFIIPYYQILYSHPSRIIK